MYTITFYSFKGGVGRTMALVNVAAELVRRGRKVLVVDFDLEAPGLETYRRLQPPKPSPGIVEYVTKYRQTYTVPDLRDYIYEPPPIGDKGGRLWVMPAGRRDRDYHTALANLNWQRLYKDQKGFLLFEDTKKGWEEELKPDYVLIDSRTGDTDVQGICTRQLPDSVVLMFMPNEQNLAGLEGVCRAIRNEETEGLKKTIRLHFVAANVPDLDDEKRILHRQLTAFRDRLGIPERPEKIRKIHRYESLDLLDQTIFTLDRRHSRLAHEHLRLVRTLIQHNLADRDGALRFLAVYAQQDLSDLAPNRPGGETQRELRRIIGQNDPLNTIAAHFLDDADILYQVAQCRKLEGDFVAAVGLLTQALNVNPDLAPALYERAMGRSQLGDSNGAAEDLLRYLRTSALGKADVLRALRPLHSIAPDSVPEAVDLAAIQALPDRTKLFDVCPLLTDSDKRTQQAIGIVRHLMAHPDPASGLGSMPAEQLPLYLLAARRWREVIELLEPKGRDNLVPFVEPFVLALAYWGETGELPEDLCRLNLEVDEQVWGGTELACLAPDIGCWVQWRVGNIPEALRLLDLDEKEVVSRGKLTFSFWRCRFVYSEKYLDDCQQLRRMIQGEPIRPPFLGPPPSGSPSAHEAESPPKSTG